MSTLEELTGAAYLSYSGLSTYLECGEKFRLTRVNKAPRSPAYWFAGGTAVHYGAEVYDLNVALDGNSHEVAMDAAIKGFHHSFQAEIAKANEENPGAEWRAGGRATKANPNKEDDWWWALDGPIQVKQYCEWRQAHNLLNLWVTPDGTLAVELGYELTLPGSTTPTRGYIDRVFQHKGTGELITVDLKSGSRVPADVTQLGLYSSAIEAKYGVRPQFAAYYMTRKAELTERVDLTRFNAGMLGQWLDKARVGIEAGVFLPHITSMCGTCEVRDLCYAKNGDIPVPDLTSF